MVDAVLLVVDATEGPMSQTKVEFPPPLPPLSPGLMFLRTPVPRRCGGSTAFVTGEKNRRGGRGGVQNRVWKDVCPRSLAVSKERSLASKTEQEKERRTEPLVVKSRIMLNGFSYFTELAFFSEDLKSRP